MVVRKDELTNFLTEEQRRIMKNIEERIDGALRKNYVPGKTVTVELNGWPHERVREELTKRYRDAGWKIIFEEDQREGTWIAVR